MKKANFSPLQKMTIEEIKADSMRDYNPSEWDKIIDRYASQTNPIFYKEPANKIITYDIFYCVYTIEEGIRILGKVAYHSMMSGSGFTEVKIEDNNLYILGVNGNVELRGKNIKANRDTFALLSQSFGKIWSNEF